LDVCCTGPNAIVSLRFQDIARLLDHGRASHIGFDRPPPPPKPGWARKEAEESVFARVFPVLTRDQTGTCTLLTADRMCGAYPSWPLSCARYPYALDLQLKVIFYAKGCGSTLDVRPADAPVRVRSLVRAVVDAYNERIKDVLLLALAQHELRDLGLLQHVRVEQFPIRAPKRAAASPGPITPAAAPGS
jgi:hypothetical protein